MENPEERFYIVCTTAEPYLFPTGYYDPQGSWVKRRCDAARFQELSDAEGFTELHGIKLGSECHIRLEINGIE